MCIRFETRQFDPVDDIRDNVVVAVVMSWVEEEGWKQKKGFRFIATATADKDARQPRAWKSRARPKIDIDMDRPCQYKGSLNVKGMNDEAARS